MFSRFLHFFGRTGVPRLDPIVTLEPQAIGSMPGSGYILGAIRGATHHELPPRTEPCEQVSAPRGHYP
jgi:hypothetical protein